jgi:hypothetical protein
MRFLFFSTPPSPLSAAKNAAKRGRKDFSARLQHPAAQNVPPDAAISHSF